MAIDAENACVSELRENKRQSYAKHVPESARRLYSQAIRGKASPRQAIKAKCQNCMGYEEFRVRIAECTAEATCPLWPYRPYQAKTKRSET